MLTPQSLVPQMTLALEGLGTCDDARASIQTRHGRTRTFTAVRYDILRLPDVRTRIFHGVLVSVYYQFLHAAFKPKCCSSISESAEM